MRYLPLIGLVAATLFMGCKKNNEPTRTASIKSIKATAWPTTNASGAPWDATSAPDLYFEILESDFSQVPNDPADDFVYVNQTDMLVTRTMETPYRIANPDEIYYIQLVDNDEADPDDVIGKVGFELDDYPDRPAVIFRTQNGITLEIGLQWE